MFKLKLLILLGILVGSQNLFAQFIPLNYPSKAFVDDAGNVYMTGKGSNNQIFVTKIVDNNIDWSVSYSNPATTDDDRGLDVVVDGDYNVFVVGYINNSNNNYDIALLKYSPTGTLTDDEIINYNGGNDVGLSLAVDDSSRIYVAGYVTGSNGADFYIRRFNNNLTTNWSSPLIYNDDTYDNNDIGTQVLVDEEFVYVQGYSYRGTTYLNDLVRIVCNRFNGAFNTSTDLHILERAGYEEKPIDFIISDEYDGPPPRLKSKTATTGTSLDTRTGLTTDYITLGFEEGFSSTLDWVRIKTRSSNDIPTVIRSDESGNVYVTGYSWGGTSQYDFMTVKYDNDGNEELVYIDDVSNGNDQPTSLRFSTNFGTMYASGYSENSTNEYVEFSHATTDAPNQQVTHSSYQPSFLENDKEQKGFVHSGTDKYGNVINVYIGSNGNKQNLAITKYSPDNKLLMKVEHPDFNNIMNTASLPAKYSMMQNYPNPFNPVTNITYSINQPGYVKLTVYNSVGKEVSSLVNEFKNNGTYNVSFNGSQFASGVYFYRLEVNGFSQTNKMLLIK